MPPSPTGTALGTTTRIPWARSSRDTSVSRRRLTKQPPPRQTVRGAPSETARSASAAVASATVVWKAAASGGTGVPSARRSSKAARVGAGS